MLFDAKSRPTRGQKEDTIDLGTLISELRIALRRLYDPNALRSSPLVLWLDPGPASNSAANLHRALLEAIEALQPADDTPQQSRMWRTHETLYYRYVQQFSQPEVAAQLGLSVRQLRREERSALEALAHTFARLHGMSIVPDSARPALAQRSRGESNAGVLRDTAQGTAVTSAGATLAQQPATAPTTDLGHVIEAVLDLVQPLAVRYNVRLCAPEPSPGQVTGTPVLVRQMLLSLLTVAIHACAGATVRLVTSTNPGGVTLRITSRCPSESVCAASPDDAANIDASRRLAALIPATVRVSSTSGGWDCAITMRTVTPVRLLVIDDHPDAQQLFERYVKDTRYQYHGVIDAEETIKRAQEVGPDIILLDVMMPQADGWQVLAWLRGTPSLCDVPIVVCTVLPHRELALAQGADAFIAKPVSREVFLRSLEELHRQTALRRR